MSNQKREVELKNTSIAFKLPQKDRDRFARTARMRNESQSDVLRAAVTKYINRYIRK